MDKHLGGEGFYERLILVNTTRDYSSILDPNLNYAAKAETYQLWPALKFESWMELIMEVERTVPVGHISLMKALLTLDFKALSERRCTIDKCGYAYILGKSDPKCLLAVLQKNESGEIQIDDVVHFDFFINCFKVYKGSDLYNQAMDLIYSRMECSFIDPPSIEQSSQITAPTTSTSTRLNQTKPNSPKREEYKIVSKVALKNSTRFTTFSNVEYSLLCKKKNASKEVVVELISNKGSGELQSCAFNANINTEEEKDRTQRTGEVQCHAFPAGPSTKGKRAETQENNGEILSSFFTLKVDKNESHNDEDESHSVRLQSGSKLNPIIL